MRSTKMFFFFFTYVYTVSKTGVFSNRLSELENNVSKLRIKSSWLNSSTSTVFIGTSTYEIYFYEHSGLKYFSRFFDNTLIKFYTTVNCVFAEWTRDKLFKLVKPIPLLYQSKFLDEYNDVFLKHFDKSQKVVNKIIHKTEKFIDVLMNFINIYLSANDTSNDTHMLRVLLSLNFKINFIRTLDAETPTDENNKDFVLVRMMLGVLNWIQNFIFLNCKLSSHYSNKQFFGFSEKEQKNGLSVSKLFQKITPLNLESRERCSVKQMVLFGVIPRTFGHISWKIQNGIVTVKHVVQKIQNCPDLEIIHWYQVNIFRTITKLLLTKIRHHCALHKNISKDIFNRFETMHSRVLRGIVNLPSKIIECFSLPILKKNTSSCILKFSSYVKSFLKSTDEDSYPKDDDLKKSITVCLNSLDDIELETDTVNIIPSNEGFDNVREHLNNLPISTLEEYIVYLEQIADDLKCFIRFFEFLHSENVLYNVPSTEKIEKIKYFEKQLIENEIRNDEETEQRSLEKETQAKQEFLNRQGCYYFKSMYHYCLDTIIHLNIANGENMYENIYDIQVTSNLEKVKMFLLELTNEYWHFPHFKVVHNIIPLIELQTEFKFSTKIHDIKRLVLVIMAELNNYSIEYCNPAEFNYLFFNNINFDTIGLLSTRVNDEIKTSMSVMKKQTKGSDCTYSRIRDIFKMFFESSNVFTKYSNIRLIWKGKKQKIEEIYNSFVYAILSPSNLYATYHFYLKFAIAILYYEICNAFNLVPNLKRDLKIKYHFKLHLKEHEFPTVYKKIIRSIKDFNRFHENQPILEENIIKNDKNKIKDEFEKIGVSIDFSISDADKYDISTNLTTEEEIDSCLRELFLTAQSDVEGIVYFINKVINNWNRNCVYGKT